MRLRTLVVVLLALAAVGIVAAFVYVAQVTSDTDLEATLGGSQRHRDPIAVPARACPALAQVRTTAADAATGWLEQAGSTTESWRTFASQLAPRLDAFAAALQLAIPASPIPIANQLDKVLHQVDIGRFALPGSTELYDYLATTNYAVITGAEALSEASDLVGDGCGAPLYTPST